ncbi:hypothetical protein CFE90_12805 [Listeria monocytogenes]|uniref:hypothetical protein n=1 Tax=Listeria TaxID=1637 RepID=UPI0007668073|nr:MULTISPECIES: hypothetical protein [Listeria]EAC5747453.1 hypothetical protein [Listeria monocytogenes]EAC7787699.1 hypothetical protein [Listeria monocytogenes]EAC8158073.1 hypothetical protein [Listeria monocytogenes]EAC9723682.1 hypothetical protein [Listeria monocytogenes]EAD3226293.1 hypothetical protein [Listeria monocytogenes]
MSKTEGQNIVICKNCGSNSVKYTGNISTFLLYASLACIVVGAIIPFIGWFIILPIGLISMISSIIAYFLVNKSYFKCQSCKHSFKVSLDEYKLYKASIK